MKLVEIFKSVELYRRDCVEFLYPIDIEAPNNIKIREVENFNPQLVVLPSRAIGFLFFHYYLTTLTNKHDNELTLISKDFFRDNGKQYFCGGIVYSMDEFVKKYKSFLRKYRSWFDNYQPENVIVFDFGYPTIELTVFIFNDGDELLKPPAGLI
ncbi:MAG: hypothetical protein WC795_01860 [Candidatus Paceibacterota bacterium]|jgi:hypothetical protein